MPCLRRDESCSSSCSPCLWFDLTHTQGTSSSIAPVRTSYDHCWLARSSIVYEREVCSWSWTCKYLTRRHALLLLLPPWWHCMVRLRHERSPRRPRLRPIDRHAAAATAVDGGRSAWIDTCPPPVIAWCVMGGIRAVFSLVGPSLQLRYLASSSFIYSSVCRSIPTGQVTSARTKKKRC